MTLYYVNLLLILGLAWPLVVYKPRWDKKILYLSVTFGYMFLLAALRFHIGFDYNSYLQISRSNAALPWSRVFQGSTEFGYTILDKLVTTFSTNALVFYSVMSAIILIPVAVFIYRYSVNIWMSTLIYATLTFFYGAMNFVRQNIAASIILMGYGFFKARKTIPFLLLVGLAATFHITALIMIPIYFFAGIKPTRKVLIFYGSITLVLYLTSRMILQLITQYAFSQYVNSVWLTQGFSLKYIIVPSILTLGTMISYPAMQKRFGSEGVLNANLMLFSWMIWLFITRHFILERFSLYVYIFSLIAIPMACECLKSPPEVYEEYAALSDADPATAKSSSGKKLSARIKELNLSIRDHNRYYWSAAVAVILICLVYNAFGAVDGFHGVFPYTSYLDINRLLGSL
jgi:hypothetical protein